MKSFLVIFYFNLFLLLFITACNHDTEIKSPIEKQVPIKSVVEKKDSIIEDVGDSIKGDFNGDGKAEYMWMIAPKNNTEEIECEGSCDCYIAFSDSTIPKIKIESCIGGYPVNEGDLNKNKSDEIGLLPHWFTSCWRSYLVWTFKDGKWVNAVDPISTHCSQWEEGIEPIEIDKEQEGNVIVRYSQLTEDSMIVVSKSVRIIK